MDSIAPRVRAEVAHGDRGPPMHPLDDVAHRPWPLPTGPWVMRQTWHDLLFAHWRVPVDALRAQVPGELELSTFGGSAWIGLVPFRMSGVRLRGLPPVPGAAAFPELNLRTYVEHEGRAGIHFFCLEAKSRLAVEVARAWFALPYLHAQMSCAPRGDDVEYTSRRVDRRGSAAEFEGRYGPRGAAFFAREGTLEHWLTERYCLYSRTRSGKILRGEIHHAPWSLQVATLEVRRNTIPSAHAIEVGAGAPLCHFARRQDVWVWAPRAISARP